MTSYVTGVENVLRAIGKLKKDTGPKIEDGLTKCGEIILKKSQKYVPRETGALAETGHIEVTGKGLGARVKVVYGGEEAPYALFVHEDLSKYHEPPTCAQFLTRSVRESRGNCAKTLQREMEAKPVKVMDGGEVK